MIHIRLAAASEEVLHGAELFALWGAAH